MPKNQIGFELGAISHRIKRAVDTAVAEKVGSGISAVQCHVIGFIVHSDVPVYQYDIEKRFGIRRSTATELLQLMEKNGLVTRIQDGDDARKKMLVLTEEAKKLSDCIDNAISEFENELTASLTALELSEFSGIIEKLDNAIGKYEKKEKGKQ